MYVFLKEAYGIEWLIVGGGKVCIHSRKVGKIVNKILRWLFIWLGLVTVIISPSSAFVPFVLHCRDLITMYRSWSVPSSFLEDEHMTSGKNITLCSCSVRVRLQPYLLWNWLTKVFSWIEMTREKNEISAYGGFLSLWHPPPSPVDGGGAILQTTVAGVSLKKKKGDRKRINIPSLAAPHFLAPHPVHCPP